MVWVQRRSWSCAHAALQSIPKLQVDPHARPASQSCVLFCVDPFGFVVLFLAGYCPALFSYGRRPPAQTTPTHQSSGDPEREARQTDIRSNRDRCVCVYVCLYMLARVLTSPRGKVIMYAFSLLITGSTRSPVLLCLLCHPAATPHQGEFLGRIVLLQTYRSSVSVVALLELEPLCVASHFPAFLPSFPSFLPLYLLTLSQSRKAWLRF